MDTKPSEELVLSKIKVKKPFRKIFTRKYDYKKREQLQSNHDKNRKPNDKSSIGKNDKRSLLRKTKKRKLEMTKNI